MHEIYLQSLSTDDQMFIAIYKVSIFDEFQQLGYLYNLLGLEVASGALGDILECTNFVLSVQYPSAPISPHPPKSK